MLTQLFVLQVWDFPGQIDFFDQTFDSEVLFGNCGALVFVIDAQVRSFCFVAFLQLVNVQHVHTLSLSWCMTLIACQKDENLSLSLQYVLSTFLEEKCMCEAVRFGSN